MRTPRLTSSPTAAARSSVPSVAASAPSSTRVPTPSRGAPSVPSAIVGYHVSSTRSSLVSVARPTPQAPRVCRSSLTGLHATVAHGGQLGHGLVAQLRPIDGPRPAGEHDVELVAHV